MSSKPAVSHYIGEHYGGGIVFSVSDTGQHGLVAAIKDQSTGANWNDAKQICSNYRGGGYADWYLPSKDELDLLYLQKGVVGGFGSDYYWSSTAEYNSYDAWTQHFDSGFQGYLGKYYPDFVRAVRAF
ncbi:MAG: DUF1566 domain-containing protein [Candidatus Desantisbacteria bacterium]